MKPFGGWFGKQALSVRMAADTARPGDEFEVVVTLSDPLTGLANRRAAEAWLDAQSRDHGGLVLIIVRIDAVERVRRRLGDVAGNRMLRRCAERLRLACGPHELVARAAGAEFVAVLAARSEAEAARRSTAVRGSLAPDGTSELVVTPSTAVCWLPPRVAPPGDWIAVALRSLSCPQEAAGIAS